MSKFDFDVAVAFAPQTGEGVYDPTLDTIAATLEGVRVPGGSDSDDGLVLGDPGSGIAESGLDLQVGRRSRQKAVIGSSKTRPLADFLAAEIRTFSFAFPFCGHRANVQATPADADFRPLRGVDAILQGAGLVGAAHASVDGWSFKFGSPQPFCSLIYYFGNRLELLDLRCSQLQIVFDAGSIPIATADIVVGSVKDPTTASKPLTVASLPTLDYGEQATVSAPVVESMGNTWLNARGFQTGTLTIANTIGDVKDCNATNGILKDPNARETKFAAGLFADDTGTGEVYELEQILAEAVGDLDALSFQCGSDAAASSPAKAVQIVAPQPALDVTGPDRFGSRAANNIELILGHATANEELEIVFR